MAAVPAATVPARERASRSGIGAGGPSRAGRVCKTTAAPPGNGYRCSRNAKYSSILLIFARPVDRARLPGPAK
ncbi:hypothetical protein OIE52_47390 [Streptomyces canus]|uniref:hypothetical protein n=1 Tax=Streptomyces canus TaxID=58343 RepID=UPI002E28B4F8|nr:hypothetical protein [Streptomyces canus]